MKEKKDMIERKKTGINKRQGVITHVYGMK